jgi:sugar phosphate isomerase/epimerase
LWDPGNAYFVNVAPYPDDYESCKHVISHVHVKDGAPDSETGEPCWVELGTGEVDLLGQLRALQADGYDGVVSLENHYWPAGDMEAGVRQSFAGLQRLLARLVKSE